VRALVAHHDALRLRFERGAGGWRQTHADAAGDVPFVHVDLSALAESSRPAAVERAADSLQQSLDLKDGPLLRVAYFDFGAGHGGRLLLAVHHLAVDGVSWRILLEDLQAAYAQAARGARVSLPAKTTSFKEWAERLARHARGEEVRGEAAYWLAVKSNDSGPLPVDAAGAVDTVGSSRTLTVSLTEEETRALLAEVPAVYHTQVNDLLLTALVQAFADWTGRRRLLVDLEGHGRESVVEGADVTRTVGWFTTHYPVALDLGRAADPGEALGRVKEQLRAVPNNGIGYGLLRYLSDDRETARRLRELRSPEVSFNYLGRFDRVLEESSAFGPADESAGRAHDDGGPVSHLLRFNASVMAGRLRVSLTYGENAHRRETAARLADGYVAALRALIAHCRERRPAGYAPSDFPLAGASRRDLGLVLGQLGEGGDAQTGVLEDLYPLTPMQEGMLFESLSDPASDPYFRQYRFSLHGPLDARAFARAWQEVVNRHAALRTSFYREGLERPLQAVRRHVALPLEQQDWRGLPPGEQARRLEALHAAEQRRGLDPARAPLMRLVLVRVEDDAHQFIWSYHHLLMDGWSRSLIHREVLTLYEAYAEGRDAELEARRPYRDYVEWLGRKDAARDEGFWRERLRGFTRPNSLAGVAAPAGVTAAPGAEGVLRSQLSAAETDALLAAARRHRLTPNTLVQGAWALVLGRLGGDTDVVYGTVVSGRPTELAGSEAMMGLFINTLPVRVRVRPEESVLPWLERLQAELSALREYEHSPLAQVQRWSGVPAGRPLFETTVSFGNFWVEAAPHERRGGGLEMRDISFTERMHQALVLGVMPGPAWTFQLLYDPRRFDGGAAAAVLRDVAALLKELISRPERRLGELLPSGGTPGGEDPQDAADAQAEFVF
jgi:non-ribosomal peptide synthase protein (TIGR01720 family)